MTIVKHAIQIIELNIYIAQALFLAGYQSNSGIMGRGNNAVCTLTCEHSNITNSTTDVLDFIHTKPAVKRNKIGKKITKRLTILFPQAKTQNLCRLILFHYYGFLLFTVYCTMAMKVLIGKVSRFTSVFLIMGRL